MHSIPLSEFHDLPARLIWGLTHLNETAREQTCVRACFDLARYAMRQHVQIISESRDHLKEMQMNKLTASILEILRRRTSCPLRELLRTQTVQRKESLMPAVNRLMAEGRIVLAADNHYRLVSQVGSN